MPAQDRRQQDYRDTVKRPVRRDTAPGPADGETGKREPMRRREKIRQRREQSQ